MQSRAVSKQPWTASVSLGVAGLLVLRLLVGQCEATAGQWQVRIDLQQVSAIVCADIASLHGAIVLEFRLLRFIFFDDEEVSEDAEHLAFGERLFFRSASLWCPAIFGEDMGNCCWRGVEQSRQFDACEQFHSEHLR